MDRQKRLIDMMWEEVEEGIDMEILACPEVIKLSQEEEDAFDAICQYIPIESLFLMTDYLRARRELNRRREKELFCLAVKMGATIAENFYFASDEENDT